jgi:hypothetical protein
MNTSNIPVKEKYMWYLFYKFRAIIAKYLLHIDGEIQEKGVSFFQSCKVYN